MKRRTSPTLDQFIKLNYEIANDPVIFKAWEKQYLQCQIDRYIKRLQDLD